jgi:hypothetical protein
MIDVHLEMTARGCVSGTLKEWPMLYETLLIAGYPVTKDTTALQARTWARDYLGWDDDTDADLSPLSGLFKEFRCSRQDSVELSDQ